MVGPETAVARQSWSRKEPEVAAGRTGSEAGRGTVEVVVALQMVVQARG
jgi:hypothetical protein